VAIAALGLALALPCHAESHPSPSPTLTLDAARGAKLYGRMCAVCHGPNGEGYAADQAPRLAQPDFLASVSDEYLRGAIADGRRGSTMSAWAQNRGGPLTRSDIDAIVVYIRGWQQGPSVRLDEQPLRADPFKGTVIFAAQCTTCHGARGVGGPQMQVGGADLLGSATDGFLRHAIRHGRPGTPMPAFEKTLSPQQIEDVVAALRSFQTRPDGHPLSRPPPLPLGPVPLNPGGPEPNGFKAEPGTTPADVVHAELVRGARLAFLDARTPSDFLREHIAGAVSVPFYDPAPYFDKLPKDTWLVCYCACPHAESGNLARELVAHGFTKVTVLDEGLGVWKARGYPVSIGESSTPTPHQ